MKAHCVFCITTPRRLTRRPGVRGVREVHGVGGVPGVGGARDKARRKSGGQGDQLGQDQFGSRAAFPLSSGLCVTIIISEIKND